MRQTRPIGPVLRIAVWDTIPAGQAVHFRTVVAQFRGWFSRDRLQNEIDALLRARHIRKVRRDTYTRNTAWFPVHKALIAVELKLARPSEALRQAVQCLTFADKVFVALPKPLAQAVAYTRRDEFLDAGVGVLAVTRQRTEAVLVACPGRRRVQLDRVAQFHAVERIWRTYVQAASGHAKAAEH